MPKERLTMEQIMLWVTIFGIIVIPLVGWLINTLITKKIDNLEAKQEEDKKLFFRKLDEDRENVEDHYVRQDIYNQAMTYHNEKSDEKFKSLLSIVNTQFSNMENKFDNVQEDIAEIKKLINDKINGGKL